MEDSGYELSYDAEQDLHGIAQYTLKTWGKKAFQEYLRGLKQVLRAISKNKPSGRAFSLAFPYLLVSKYESHYIFYISENRTSPSLLALSMREEILLID